MPEKYILNQRWYSGEAFIFDNIFKQHLYIQLVAIYLIVTNLRIQEKWKKLEHLIYKNHNKQSQVIIHTLSYAIALPQPMTLKECFRKLKLYHISSYINQVLCNKDLK